MCLKPVWTGFQWDVNKHDSPRSYLVWKEKPATQRKCFPTPFSQRLSSPLRTTTPYHSHHHDFPIHWHLRPKPLALLQQIWRAGCGSKPRRTLTVTRTTKLALLKLWLNCSCCRAEGSSRNSGSDTTEPRPSLLDVYNTLNSQGSQS